MHGALRGGPDALPLVHDDSPRDEAIAAFPLYVLQRLGVSDSAQPGKDERVFRIVYL